MVADESLRQEVLQLVPQQEPFRFIDEIISLDDEQIELLHSLKGFGTKEAEKVKNIFLAYLSEKEYIKELNSK